MMFLRGDSTSVVPTAPGDVVEFKSRQICTYFAMGGCSRGDRCVYSHELTQEAPAGVDVSAGFFISGKVANYKAGGGSSAASSPTASLSAGLNPQAKAFLMPATASADNGTMDMSVLTGSKLHDTCSGVTDSLQSSSVGLTSGSVHVFEHSTSAYRASGEGSLDVSTSDLRSAAIVQPVAYIPLVNGAASTYSASPSSTHSSLGCSYPLRASPMPNSTQVVTKASSPVSAVPARCTAANFTIAAAEDRIATPLSSASVSSTTVVSSVLPSHAVAAATSSNTVRSSMVYPPNSTPATIAHAVPASQAVSIPHSSVSLMQQPYKPALPGYTAGATPLVMGQTVQPVTIAPQYVLTAAGPTPIAMLPLAGSGQGGFYFIDGNVLRSIQQPMYQAVPLHH